MDYGINQIRKSVNWCLEHGNEPCDAEQCVFVNNGCTKKALKELLEFVDFAYNNGYKAGIATAEGDFDDTDVLATSDYRFGFRSGYSSGYINGQEDAKVQNENAHESVIS